MTPSDHQLIALRAVVAWHNRWRAGDHRQQVCRLAGYAGTGKTWLAKFIVDELNLSRVCAACPTGKAAHVLRRRGFSQSRTIHSLIYRPVVRGRGRVPELEAQVLQLIAENAPPEMVKRVEREIAEEIEGLHRMAFSLKIDSELRGADLLVVDESSMVSNDLLEDLLSFGAPILALGDPAQLPPVRGSGSLASSAPDAMLEEIHRQAMESAVVRLATIVRQGGRLSPGDHLDATGHTSRIVLKAEPHELMSADQIIVGRNATRHRTNAWVRSQLGRKSPLPEAGDRLVCLRNSAEHSLMNGATYRADADAVVVDDMTSMLALTSDDFPESGSQELLIHSKLFGADPKEALKPWEWELASAFDFGAALTCHKSQASQWNRVAIRMEWPNADTLQQWAYTALTRAAEEVYVVL
jgi:exodeoxyribonuclease-5